MTVPTDTWTTGDTEIIARAVIEHRPSTTPSPGICACRAVPRNSTNGSNSLNRVSIRCGRTG